MKDTIVGLALLMILLIFPIQAQLEIVNNNKITMFNDIVYRSTQKARMDGYFTENNINELQEELQRIFRNSEVTIIVDTTPRYRTLEFNDGEVINYDIQVTLDRLIFFNNFLSIDDASNEKVLRKQGYVLSELNK